MKGIVQVISTKRIFFCKDLILAGAEIVKQQQNERNTDMPQCYKCGAVNCRLTKVSAIGNSYICDSCRAEEKELHRKMDNAKKGVVLFLLTKVVPFFFPLIVGISAASSAQGVHVALIIVFAVVSALLWVGAFILGKKAPNRLAQMSCRFFRRVCFGAATGFTILACEMLGVIQPAAATAS